MSTYSYSANRFSFDSLFGALLGAFIGLLALLCFALLGFFIFAGINTIGLPTQSTTGVVISVSYTPSTSITSFSKVGDVMIPSTIITPESYSALVTTPFGQGNVSISEPLYRSNPVASTIKVNYVMGRITNKPELISGH